MKFRATKTLRTHRWDIGLGLLVVALLTYILGYRCDQSCADWDYVSDILLGEPFLGKDVVIWRWNHVPGVSVFLGTDEDLDAVRDAVTVMNRLLSGTGMKLRYSDDYEEIEIKFISREQRQRIADETDDDSMLDADGMMYLRAGEAGHMGSVSIWIMDYLSPSEKRGTILHELGHAVGFSGHTDRYLSSLFWVEWRGGAYSDGYSNRDKRLLRFLYSHLESGDTEADVRAEFDRHWDTGPSLE